MALTAEKKEKNLSKRANYKVVFHWYIAPTKIAMFILIASTMFQRGYRQGLVERTMFDIW